MAYATWEKRQINRKFPFLVLVIVFAGMIMGGVTMKSHANKHSLSSQVRKCYGEGKTKIVLENPLTGRFAFCIKVEKDQYGTMIVEEIEGMVEEVTSMMSRTKFSKNLLSRIIPYLIRGGYLEVIYSEIDLSGWLK